MSTTQYIVIGVFIISIIAGVIIFAGFGGSKNSGSGTISVSIWGTVPKDVITNLSSVLNKAKPGTIAIDYQELPLISFESTLTEALASGKGPDIVIIPHQLILKDQNKLTLIPWSSISEKSYKDTFVEGGEIFLTDTGAYAVPFIVDPMVMYWNRNMFNAKSIATVPKLWEDVAYLVPKLSDVSENKTVKKSAISFGEYQNVVHAGDIFSMLNFQAGNTFTKRSGEKILNVSLEVPDGQQNSPFVTALTFFTQFADPLKDVYSWNRSLPDSQKQFLAGNLAMYFGFASELSSLRAKNPNLDFDVATIPQAKGSVTNSTFGNFYGLAVLQNSPRKQSALQAITLMVSADSIKSVSQSTGLPPIRRDLLATLPGTQTGDVFWQSALWSRAWLDPNPYLSSGYFKSMIESVTTGEAKPDQATRIFSQQLDELLRQ